MPVLIVAPSYHLEHRPNGPCCCNMIPGGSAHSRRAVGPAVVFALVAEGLVADRCFLAWKRGLEVKR